MKLCIVEMTREVGKKTTGREDTIGARHGRYGWLLPQKREDAEGHRDDTRFFIKKKKLHKAKRGGAKKFNRSRKAETER